jgi:hypothetical protein
LRENVLLAYSPMAFGFCLVILTGEAHPNARIVVRSIPVIQQSAQSTEATRLYQEIAKENGLILNCLWHL